MNRAPSLLTIAIVSGLFACSDQASPGVSSSAPSATSTGSAAATATLPSSTHGAPSAAAPPGAITCEANADCPTLPCGPCIPGTLVTKELLQGPSCTRNPCKRPESICNDDSVCVVSPETEKDPAVFGSAKPR